jgi:hypothetical protein
VGYSRSNFSSGETHASRYEDRSESSSDVRAFPDRPVARRAAVRASCGVARERRLATHGHTNALPGHSRGAYNKNFTMQLRKAMLAGLFALAVLLTIGTDLGAQLVFEYGTAINWSTAQQQK